MVAGFRDLDVGLLVAAAGFGTSGPFLDSDLTQELEMLDVNCRALLSQSLHFGRRFAERGRGGLILLASLVGFQGAPFSANYAATKAYVQSLAEALHVELALRGVDVLASAPGPAALKRVPSSRTRLTAAACAESRWSAATSSASQESGLTPENLPLSVRTTEKPTDPLITFVDGSTMKVKIMEMGSTSLFAIVIEVL